MSKKPSEAKKYFDNQVKQIENEYAEKKRELDKKKDDLDRREKELNDRAGELQQRESDLERRKEEQNAEIEAAKEAARVAVEKQIRESEDEIRIEEYRSLLEKGESDAKQIRAEAQSEIEREKGKLKEAQEQLKEVQEQLDQDMEQLGKDRKVASDKQRKAAKEYAKAAEIVQEANEKLLSGEKELLNRQMELNKSIEGKQEALQNDYSAKLKELAQRRAEFDKEKAELEEDRQYVRQLKKQYSSDTTAVVLKDQFELLKKKYESLEKINRERADEILRLTDLINRNTPSDGKTAEVLQKQLEEAESLIASMPSDNQIKELQAKAAILEEVRGKLSQETDRRVKAEQLVATLDLSQRELDGVRRQAEALQALNEQLQQKLSFINETYRSNRESKFAGLLELDKEAPAQSPAGNASRKVISSLSELVTYIRSYGARRKENPLYYSEETIRTFIASLAASYSASRLIILQGLSGTGKSSLPQLFADALGTDCFFVPVQPSWRDNRELLGYDNDFTNRFKETEFTKYLYRASRSQSRMTFIVLDEMNLARIEYYFADFLSELENQKPLWTVDLIPNYNEEISGECPKALICDNGSAKLQIGKNVWFIGTANNDDSTATITDKVYDRAQVLDMEERVDSFAPAPYEPRRCDLARFKALIDAAQSNTDNCLSDTDQLNISLIDESLKKMDITFGNRIEFQLKLFVPVFVACGGTKAQAIDYYLAHKILRKLDERYDAYIKDILIDLKNQLPELYKGSDWKESIAKINTLLRRNFNQGEES